MPKKEATPHVKPGVGLDVGTMNLVAARPGIEEDSIETKRIRDAFLVLDSEAKKTLRLSKVAYVEQPNALVVLGDHALAMANLFKQDVRRPLQKGVIASGELEAQGILSLLCQNVLGSPSHEGEHCYYSVPASPVDDLSQDVIYHENIFRKILQELGFTPHPMNEAMAIIYSSCAAEQFSGLSVSFGSGMGNVALAFQTVKGMEFSVVRGGDWIDEHAAKALGTTASKVCAMKEKGIDLANPKGREAEAIALYIRALIKYVLDNISVQFKKDAANVSLPDPVPFIVSGGTSLAIGFMDVFKEEFEKVQKKGFPIAISEVRLANNPMTSVAEGLLILAQEEYNED